MVRVKMNEIVDGYIRMGGYKITVVDKSIRIDNLGCEENQLSGISIDIYDNVAYWRRYYKDMVVYYKAELSEKDMQIINDKLRSAIQENDVDYINDIEIFIRGIIKHQIF